MDSVTQRGRYHEIKSAFAHIITERQDDILSGASADATIAYLQQHGYTWVSSVAIPVDPGHYQWNDAFIEALRQRRLCERMLAAGASVDDVIALLRDQGYSLVEVAAFFEGLAGVASGRARALVAAHFGQTAVQA